MKTNNISKLPIFANNNFDSSTISEIGEGISNKLGGFRKGEKGLFNIFKIASLIGIGYMSWIYVLPPVFKAIGQTLAIVGTLGIIIAAIFMLPVFLKALRYFTRFCHKLVIKHNPFAVLEEQREKIIKNKQKFHKSKGRVTSLKNDMYRYSKEAEDKAKEVEKRVLTLSDKATKVKERMAKIIKEKNEEAKTDDEYINLHVEYNKYLAESQRRSFELEQQKSFVIKYGSRADVMKKLDQKLTLVSASMDNKILDLDSTIDILKKDYEFAKNAKEATTTAKNAMMFTDGWEFEYAMNVVTNTIAEDIAITSSNLNDIETYTSNFNVDSDDLFNSLSMLAEDIKVGDSIIPSSKAYTAPDYQQTHEDRLNSGGFGDVF